MATDNIGIYKIVSLDNKIYIGSAVNLRRRKQQHFNCLKNNTHSNKIIQNYYNKYGSSSLFFTVIENVSNKEELVKREQYFIDLLNPEFNICKIAYSMIGLPSPMKGKKLTQEHKDKIVASRGKWKMSDEQKEKLRKAATGRKKNYITIITDETKRKISETRKSLGIKLSEEHKAKLTFKGMKHTDEHKKYMSLKLKGRKLSEAHKLALRKPKNKTILNGNG